MWNEHGFVLEWEENGGKKTLFVNLLIKMNGKCNICDGWMLQK